MFKKVNPFSLPDDVMPTTIWAGKRPTYSAKDGGRTEYVWWPEPWGSLERYVKYSLLLRYMLIWFVTLMFLLCVIMFNV